MHHSDMCARPNIIPQILFLFRDEPFIPYIDALPTMKRNSDGPFMMPIVDKYSEMGTVVIGKVESGHCEKGQNLSIYPNRTDVKVDQLWSDDIEVTKVTCGENVKVKLKGVDEAGITPGFVLCDPQNPIKSCRTFDAKVCYLETIMYISLIFLLRDPKLVRFLAKNQRTQMGQNWFLDPGFTVSGGKKLLFLIKTMLYRGIRVISFQKNPC